MNKNVLLYIFGGLVLVLSGIIIGQNFTLSRKDVENTLAPPQQVNNLTQRTAESPEQKQIQLLTKNEYWISHKKSLQNKIGFSSWIALRPQGNFIFEKCQAPDYSTPEDHSGNIALSFPSGRCSILIDGHIAELDKTKITVSSRTGEKSVIPFFYKNDGKNEELMLDVNGKIYLEPGSKNVLVQNLANLESVVEKRKLYFQSRSKMEKERIKGK